MFFKQAYFGALLLMFFALLTQAHEEQCQNTQDLSKCICIETKSSGKSMKSVKCTGATAELIWSDFGKLQHIGNQYKELEISESDLKDFAEIPEHMQPEILKIVSVTNLPLDKLQVLFSSVPDIKYLMVDGVAMPKIKKDLFGEKLKLETLSLNGNGIEDIADDTFEHFHALEKLSLEDNKLTKIPQAVLTTPAQHLDLKLNGNPISQLTEEELKIIKEKQIAFFMNSIDCACTKKESPFMKWAKETKSDDIYCAAPEKVKGVRVGTFMDETDKYCGGADGAAFLSSFLLIVALYISHLVK